ncbi:P-loop containing nucleoside triphosphate hydrolase protein [Penicillium cataractarum]|uniref:P-loop containing nucleoside triphosphate hydrolase protein n=1 Tax=Penicillium cataractarum TaxID=2100454 RepID=A0A9W9S6E9_9EURO|nr:P-loop containing nucleoside triphosphate hydrolase protein [Penicillium cataractarum]KAJ5370483.1 P-loop containing nucleoside triphosphate hydrolase protein [Penicillium cataractarum]
MISKPEDKAMHQLRCQQSELLDKIDELRGIGVGGLVELPQLIVCGSQSSGKSSVLEAISRVRFPTKGTLCTRFATEVILRRKPQTRVKVSIEPGDSRTDERERERLRNFTSEAFSSDNDLSELINQARDFMGISDNVNQHAGFSDDVLKIEISGPDKPELTLVDLPGLYTSASKEQSKEGIPIVRQLTERYMAKSRSIILAVISAKVDYHIQEVLDIAKDHDPHYERVLAIVTHTDKLDEGSDEEERYLQYIRNEGIKLKLGWHALRNRSHKTRNVPDDERDEEERVHFSKGRWASLPRAHVGIDRLRHRLSSILLKHIAGNLPILIRDIDQKIDDRKQSLAKLGTARPTTRDQRGFLLNISSNFQRIAAEALNGMYSKDFFGGLNNELLESGDARRLRAVIRELNEYFADAMSMHGFRRQLPKGVSEVPKPLSDLRNLKFQSYLNQWVPEMVTEEELMNQMMRQASNNRGIEFPGSANQLLVGELFRDQARPWGDIAQYHLNQAWESVNEFVQLAFGYLTDDSTQKALLAGVINPELEKLRDSLDNKLDELLSYTTSGHPLPIGRSFLERIQQSRINHQMRNLKDNLVFSNNSSENWGEQGQNTFTLHDLENAATQLQTTEGQFAVVDIVTQMQTYYETAILVFIDNVAILAIENCLLRPLEHIFSNQVINSMDDEEIEKLAGESQEVKEERERLSRELKKLEAGMRTLSTFSADRSSLSRPSALEAQLPLAEGAALITGATRLLSKSMEVRTGQIIREVLRLAMSIEFLA